MHIGGWSVSGPVFTLARFSEAFLVLRAQQGGLPVAWVPLVLVAMNVVYAMSAYPFGKLSDSMSHTKLLALGLAVLIAADLAIADSDSLGGVFAGSLLWGLHMGMTQGLLATMVADTAPEDLRGTAFGFFNLFAGLTLRSRASWPVWCGIGSARPSPSTWVRSSAFLLWRASRSSRGPRPGRKDKLYGRNREARSSPRPI